MPWMPARPIDVMSLPAARFVARDCSPRGYDHDFVIVTLLGNKLKD
jgi:hypothetical protein